MIYSLLLTFTLTFLGQLAVAYFRGNDQATLQWVLQAWGKPTHELYRYLTYAWMHSTLYPWHLFINLLGIFYLGRDLEKRFSKFKILFVFLFGILLGALLWRSLPAYGDYPKWRLMGCSAGICAWFALELLEVIRSGKPVARGQALGLLAGSLLFELLCWKMGWLGFIAHTAHLGGFLAGILAYLFLKREETLVSKTKNLKDIVSRTPIAKR